MAELGGVLETVGEDRVEPDHGPDAIGVLQVDDLLRLLAETVLRLPPPLVQMEDEVVAARVLRPTDLTDQLPGTIVVADQATQRAWGVTAFPTNVWVRPDGTVASRSVGMTTRPVMRWHLDDARP